MTTSTYQPREDGESLAMHLHRNAEVLGADRDQRARLRQAAALSLGGRDSRILGGQIAASVRDELKAGLEAVVFAAQARGEKVEAWKAEGAMRIKGRDGLGMLFDSGALTEGQWNTGLIYRALYETRSSSLGSQLGQVSEGSSARTSTDAMVRHGLQAAYTGLRLSSAEAALACPDRVAVLRAVVGEGRSIRSLASGARARKVMVERLVEDLGKVAASLAQTGGLRIRGQ